jgi:radical SAM superfamily enzyme YgiQ (UPF0313 family)
MIVLINPPNPPGKISNKDMMGGLGQLYNKGGALVPPIDIPYIAGGLLKNNIPVKVIDCLGLQYDFNKLIEELLEIENITSIAIRTSLPTYSFDLKTAYHIKKAINIPIVFFGSYVSMALEETLMHHSVDIVVTGEPENTFVDLCLKGKEEAAGIWYKNNEGKIIKNKFSEKHKDLDNLPYPAWDLMPYKNYYLPSKQFQNNDPFLPVLTSRGCPFGCDYCPYPVLQGKKWRARSAGNIFGELEYIIEELGISNVLFRDPEFTLNRSRIMELCGNITKSALSFSWRCETRIDTLDEELIEEMSKAGCIGINFGIETSDPEIAKSVNRKVCPEDRMQYLIQYCQRRKINVFCFFIIGLPGQNKQEIFNLIDLALSLDSDEIQITYATPYPGTILSAWAEENGYIVERNFENYTGYHPVMRNEYFSTKQLKHFFRFAQHALHMRKRLKALRIKKGGFFQPFIENAKEIFLVLEKILLAGFRK